MKRILVSKFFRKDKFCGIFELVKGNMGMCLLFLSLLSGIVVGSMTSRFSDDSMLTRLDLFFNSNVSLRVNDPIMENFIASFASYFIFVLIEFLLGLSLWGMFVVPFVVFINGFGTGLSGGYLCLRYGIVGFSFNAFVLLPGTLISSIAIVILSKEAIKFSVGMATKFFRIGLFEKYSCYTSIKTFFIRTGMILIFVAMASVVDVLLTSLFANFFDFSSVGMI